jgi:hypothetical protein
MRGESFGTLTFKESRTGTGLDAQFRSAVETNCGSWENRSPRFSNRVSTMRPRSFHLQQISMSPNKYSSSRQTRPYRVAGVAEVVNVACQQVTGVGEEDIRVLPNSGGAISLPWRSIGLKNSGCAIQRFISNEGVQE